MGEEAGAARALFERFLKARRANPALGFEDWLEDHAQLADSLRELNSQQSTALFCSPHEAPGGTASFSPGEELGDFRLIEYLGSGGMGEVWKAEQLSVRRPVALKLIRRDKQLTPRALQRFEREAQAGARINHPNIASVYTVGRTGDRPYIAQELIEDGSPLSEFLDGVRGEQLPSDYFVKVAALFTKVLDALQAAHDAGVIHRDLKPQNILVTAADEPVIVDFGLARIEDADPLSHTGDLVGTYFYMSPEQAMSLRMGIDHRTDVFSAGATLYELLTFRRAFDGETTHEVAEKIIFSDPPDPRSIEHRVPRDLAVICTKALEKRRQDRYQTAGEFADDVRRYLADEPIHARPVTLLDRGLRWIRRHPGVAAASAIGLAAAVGLIWLIAALSSSTEQTAAARRDELYSQATLALELNELDQAIELIDQADGIDPTSPYGHVILALGFAKFSRVAEMEAQLRVAVDRGFRTDGSDLQSELDHIAYGLHLMSFRDLDLYPQAEEHMRIALERDEKRFATAHYLLYQMHVALQQKDAARADLQAFQEHLATGNPFWPVAEGLEAELDGDHARACALLEELASRDDVDERRRIDLRIDRNLGRNYLALGDLDRAEANLRRAVTEPRDCGSMNSLAALSFERYRANEDNLHWLDQLQDWSAKAIECGDLMRLPWMLATWSAIERFGKEVPSGSPRERASWAAASEALAALEQRDPEDVDLPRLRARLLFLESEYPRSMGDHAAAADLLRAALHEYPESLRARTLLGECLWYLREYERGLAELEAALALWDDRENEGRWKGWWGGVALTWAYGNAVAAGDATAVGRLRQRIETELDVPGSFTPRELLSLAEFLAAEDSPELRDCSLALDIVERFELRTAFLGTPVEGQATGLLDKIDQLCP